MPSARRYFAVQFLGDKYVWSIWNTNGVEVRAAVLGRGEVVGGVVPAALRLALRDLLELEAAK